MIETELGEWRRTHYSNNLDPSLTETDVIIMGWVSSVRGHGNILFLTIIDRMGEIQIVAKKDSCPDNVFETISKLKEHSCIGLKGKINASEKAPTGVEIYPEDIRVFSMVEKVPPFDPYVKTIKNIDTRLEMRAIDLRRDSLKKIFQARSEVLKVIREYFYEENFVETNTPKMIATATEGGAALFPIFYYNKEAFLAQSPQLYKEQLTMSFEKVFEIAPIFRAEPSRTNRHLSEAISIDFEEAYVDYNDIMKRIEHVITHSISAVQKFSNDNSGTGLSSLENGHFNGGLSTKPPFPCGFGRFRRQTDLYRITNRLDGRPPCFDGDVSCQNPYPAFTKWSKASSGL